MRRHTLTRFAETPDGVFGRLGPWLTVEEEDRANQRNVSCIPVGTYRCRRRMYHRGGYETFEITGVPDRSAILFHKANTEEDVEGCIGIARTLGVLVVADEDSGLPAHKLAGLYSGAAFDEFMQAFASVDQWDLEIVEHGL